MKTITLADRDFSVDSTGWIEEVRDGVICKVSPKTDEFKEGEITETTLNSMKVQYFTWARAMYEVKKAGKRMPTKEEYERLTG